MPAITIEFPYQSSYSSTILLVYSWKFNESILISNMLYLIQFLHRLYWKTWGCHASATACLVLVPRNIATDRYHRLKKWDTSFIRSIKVQFWWHWINRVTNLSIMTESSVNMGHLTLCIWNNRLIIATKMCHLGQLEPPEGSVTNRRCQRTAVTYYVVGMGTTQKRYLSSKSP